MTLSYSRTALILLAATSLSACTTYAPFGEDAQVARPNYPTRLPPPDTQTLPPAQSGPDQAPAPQAGPATSPVQSRPLDPVPNGPAYVTPSTPPYTPPPAYQPPYQPPPVVMQTITKQTVTGKVVAAAGPPKSHTVKSGDNLDAIARAMGTTRKQLAEDNDLKEPYVLRPGKVLKGPSSDAKAYVVGSGDTLYAIARRFSVTGQALAEANDMGLDDPLTTGRKLILPDGFKDKGPTTVTTRVQVPGTGLQTPAPAPFQPQAPAQQTPTYTPPPIVQPEPEPPRTTTTSSTKTSVTGKLVDVAGPPQIYTVKNGQALDAIARAMDTTRKQLADDNKLKEPYVLHAGDKLKGPRSTMKAYVAGSGDTLALIARRFSVTPKALAAANDMKVGDAIRSGRKITLPDGYKDKGPIKETVRTTVTLPPEPRRDPTPAAPPPSRPYTPPPAQPVTPPPSTSNYSRPTPPTPSRPTPPPASSSGPLSDSQITAQGRGRFNWPLRGDIISDFGPKGTGQRNDGLNIRANAGEAVRAAAGGDVVYAGDQVPGFGNLVLIKHPDGWVTAYGHLARLDVKMQQKVVQGQQIGQAGTSGGVSEPQLHFEVRFASAPSERARPVDPKLVLGR
ncbi:LysM peptidoglycan-binding domain-containing protein [Phenylobacterium sp.]|uniref:LysM peptidoglycan-binding domain-containing protein n=1 Tax=Phenylobacterium sp. TaxID=1871053 RepID=UPI002733547F|nr:LysM peptidoglycan-binding domain-containing protein [Phenylobacterium sp.]MDP3632110.1 LysM peptidoglycan-binding domain-containing protein [Phenylobacterium sp.]MDP3870205.1 LysM peptidoglycan-binding domain-containing protein [Phenylobacterium sp.]